MCTVAPITILAWLLLLNLALTRVSTNLDKVITSLLYVIAMIKLSFPTLVLKQTARPCLQLFALTVYKKLLSIESHTQKVTVGPDCVLETDTKCTNVSHGLRTYALELWETCIYVNASTYRRGFLSWIHHSTQTYSTLGCINLPNDNEEGGFTRKTDISKWQNLNDSMTINSKYNTYQRRDSEQHLISHSNVY